MWVREWTSPAVAETRLIDLAYSYDKDSNPLTRDDARWGIERDEQYQHDGLGRLMQADRGEFNGGFTYGGELGQRWALDHLGNWAAFKTNAALNTNEPDFDDTEDVQEERSFNFVNELTQIVETTGASSGTFDFTYDDNGNQTGREVNPDFSGNDDLWIYTYDAWNRLVKVQVDPEGPGQGASAITRAMYTYYGLHQRATREADADYLGGVDQRNIYYYDADWRLLEERVDDDWIPSGDFVPERLIQRVWCPHYIDSLIYAHVDEPSGSDPPDGDYNDASSFYTLTDRLYSVLALVDITGGVIERVRYTSYGAPQVEHLADLDGDGEVTATDKAYIDSFTASFPITVGDPSFDPEADANQDGVVSKSDATYVNVRIGQSQSSLNTLSLIGNTVGYDGYLFDEAVGMYVGRHRWYDAGLGRWVTRDPLGVLSIDTTFYGFLLNAPLAFLDSLGLAPAGAHHPYPLFLGGDPNSGPLIYLTSEEHTAIHNHISNSLDEGKGRDPEALRESWKSKPDSEKRRIIKESLTKVGVDPDVVGKNLDNWFENSTPGKNRSPDRKFQKSNLPTIDKAGAGRQIPNAPRGRIGSAGKAGALGVIGAYFTIRDAEAQLQQGSICREYLDRMAETAQGINQWGHPIHRCPVDMLEKLADECWLEMSKSLGIHIGSSWIKAHEKFMDDCRCAF